MLNNAPLMIAAVVVALAWFIARTRVELSGVGFRPLRTIDLIEFNALDQLDAYDREQAMRAAQR